jgi:Ca2+-binding EF-hand superfamily protein
MMKYITQGRYFTNSDLYRSLSPLAKDLLEKIFVVDPEKRISIEQIKNHPWLTGMASDADMGQSHASRVSSLALRQKLCKIFFLNHISVDPPPSLDCIGSSSIESMEAANLAPQDLMDGITVERARHYFKKIDINGDGLISREELRTGISKLLCDGAGELDAAVCPRVLQNIDEAFDVMDKNHDQSVEFAEFKEFCECLALPTSSRLSGLCSRGPSGWSTNPEPEPVEGAGAMMGGSNGRGRGRGRGNGRGGAAVSVVRGRGRGNGRGGAAASVIRGREREEEALQPPAAKRRRSKR